MVLEGRVLPCTSKLGNFKSSDQIGVLQLAKYFNRVHAAFVSKYFIAIECIRLFDIFQQKKKIALLA